MIAHRHVRAAAAGGVLLAFIGLWIGHTLEYLRVWGTAGLVASITNPVHAYMLPLAAVLALLTALCGIRLCGAWRSLSDRLDKASLGLRRIWRGQTPEIPAAVPRSSSPGARLVAIWLPLAAAQIVLYLIQENVEAIAAGQQAPGWSAITGVHWAAPLVQLYVALLLACGVRIFQVLRHRRAVVVERVEALLRAFVRRRLSWLAADAATPVYRSFSPLDRLGLHIWRRPPPLPSEA